MFSMGDGTVRRGVQEWLPVVAKHLDFDACVTAAVEALSRQLPLSAFPCSKCGAIHGDLGRHAQSSRTVNSCGMCGHSTTRVPKVCGNPPAALGCQLVEGVLYVSKLPVTADGKVSASTT